MRLRYKAVLFDLGYTLIRTDRETTLQDSLRQVGVELSIADIDRAFHVARGSGISCLYRRRGRAAARGRRRIRAAAALKLRGVRK